MTTILKAIKAKNENADGDTIAKALGGGGTIATALLGDADSDDSGDDSSGDRQAVMTEGRTVRQPRTR